MAGPAKDPEGMVGRCPRFVRPQAARNLTVERRSEERASTPLELFFGLCFAAAVLVALTILESLREDPRGA